MDKFTEKRLLKFVETHRDTAGQMPTMNHLEAAGFSEEMVYRLVRDKKLIALYVTLTNGAVARVYKIAEP